MALTQEEYKKKLLEVKSKKVDLSTAEGLVSFAKNKGLEKQVNQILDTGAPKLSFLQRLSSGLGALNPAEAILTGQEKGIGEGIKKYATGAIGGISSAITGTDYQGERRTFADVAEKMGIENGILKFGVGFLGDVFLDPSTYFGGAIAKGVLGATKATSNVALKGIGKVAPATEQGLRMAGEGLQDAFGRAVNYGYKSSKGAKEAVLTFMSKEQKAKLGLAASNLNRLGTGVLTKSQSEELAAKLIAGKRAEFQLGEEVSQDAITTVNKLFPDIKVKDAKQAEEVLKGLEQRTSKQVEAIRSEVDDIVKPYFDARQKAIKSGKILESKTGVQTTPSLKGYSGVDELNKVVDKLKVKLSELRKGTGKIGVLGKQTFQDIGGKITKEEAISAHNKLLKYEEERLGSIIEDLSSKIENFKAKPKGAKVPVLEKAKLTPEEIVVYGERQIAKLQSDLAEKSRLLSTATRGRETASSIIAMARETGDYSRIQELSPDLVDRIKLDTTKNITFDPVVEKTINEQLARSKKFAQQSGVETPYETYFPFIKKDKVDKFINETRGIRVGSEGYKKQFKNLLTNENLETDPAKAFFTRESQVVSDKMTRNFLSGFVKKYGKGLEEFNSVDDALKNGYTLIKEKGMFGKELGYVNKYDGALIRDSLSPEFQTINMLAKATGFDALTSLFKRSVTGLFAPFHIRNYASGIIQNYEVLGREALDPRNLTIGHKIAYLMGRGEKIPSAIVNIGGKETKLEKIMKPFVDRFSGDTFYNNDFDMALRGGNELKKSMGTFTKERLKETIRTAGLGEEAIPFKVGRAVGQYIEHQQKATAYVTALNQGKKIEDALMIAEKAGFDYRALTRFESQILRRVIPFYSFTRKNIELQMKTLGENPQRINQVLNFFENIGEQPSQEEKQGLPDYIKESIGVKLPDTADGLKQYINSFGTPIESFASLFNKDIILQTISQMNPIIKAPIELGIGKDSFRKKDLKDVYNASEYSAAPQIIKDMLDIKEVEKPILEKNKYGKLVEVGKRKEYVANPNKLLIARSLFTSRGVSYLDQVFDGDLDGFAKFIKLFSGIKPVEIDLEVTKALKNKQQKRATEDLLIKMGYLKKFESTYEPK